MRRIALLLIGLLAAGFGLAVSVRAEEPPPNAEAVAAQVSGVAAVGHTKADATGDQTDASASALEIGDGPPSDRFGGRQRGPGHSHGALLDTGDSLPVRTQLTPWEAAGGTNGDCRTASGTAALVRVYAPSLVDLAVLRSTSSAQQCGNRSSGRAASDGAAVALGDNALTADVLHSERSSDGHGEARLAQLQGSDIGNDDQLGGPCAIDLQGLLTLACLAARGSDSGAGDARVADAAALGSGGVDAVVGYAAAAPKQTGGNANEEGSPGAGGGTAGGNPTSAGAGGAVPSEANAAAAAGRMAGTGAELARWVAAALLLLMAGSLLVLGTGQLNCQVALSRTRGRS